MGGSKSTSGKRSVKYTEDELKQAVLNYARDGFVDIRKDQAAGRYNRDAEILEDYVGKKSDSRTLYRGVRMEFGTSPEVGETINQKGLSSWTASQILGESFATDTARDGESVLFVLESGTKKGADVSALKGAGRRRETETLISKKSKQVVTSTEYKNGVKYVRLKEV